MYVATVANGDFSSLSVPLTFAPGSADGAEMCAPITANVDNLVEPEEHFTVTLTSVTTSSVSGLKLGNTQTVVAVSDSDGMFIILLQYRCQQSFCLVSVPYCAVAEFTIPSAAAVSESDLTLFVCSALATTPPSAILGMAVAVSLSTMDGTGTHDRKP